MIESASGDGLLLPDNLPADHRSGFVAVIGRPNVGKSTLVNRLLGQKVSIVSPKPQTTRNRLLGILTRPDAQVILIDTPGVHAPLHRLGRVMVDTAASALTDADVVLWMVDATSAPTPEDELVAAMLARVDPALPRLLGLNKIDLLAGESPPDWARAYADLIPEPLICRFSATRGDGVDGLVATIIGQLPVGPRYFPEEQVTDQHLRFLAAELIREQVLDHLRQEVPHAVAVAVEEYKERREGLTYISAVIFVERETQKGIVVGHDGQMLKRIGQSARRSIEEVLESRVFLELWVKVREKWRSRDEDLQRLGYHAPGQG